MPRWGRAGINLFDTADVYGGPQSPGMKQGYGLSEEFIGRWLAQGGGRRERIVLATKVYQPMGPGPNDKYLSAYRIRRAAEDSLRRLRTDHIDLYLMHHIDRSTPWEEIRQAMEQLVREGKVTYVGSSNFAGWQVATAQNAAAALAFMGLVSEQSLYNLTARTVELEMISGTAPLRHRTAAVEPAGRWPARRRAAEGAGRTPGDAADAGGRRTAPPAAPGVRGPVRPHR
jgi:aryl-alcohol dehydrogenase-like predicted oxidoreductase